MARPPASTKPLEVIDSEDNCCRRFSSWNTNDILLLQSGKACASGKRTGRPPEENTVVSFGAGDGQTKSGAASRRGIAV